MDNERRQRFRQWFALTYATKEDPRAQFMADSGKRGHEPLTKGRVTQLFDDDEPFGERAARTLAIRFGLPEDFFLKDHAPRSDQAEPTDAAVVAGLRELRRINPETHARVLSDLERIVEGARASDRLIRTKTKTPYVTSERAKETMKAPPAEPDSAFEPSGLGDLSPVKGTVVDLPPSSPTRKRSGGLGGALSRNLPTTTKRTKGR